MRGIMRNTAPNWAALLRRAGPAIGWPAGKMVCCTKEPYLTGLYGDLIVGRIARVEPIMGSIRGYVVRPFPICVGAFGVPRERFRGRSTGASERCWKKATGGLAVAPLKPGRASTSFRRHAMALWR